MPDPTAVTIAAGARIQFASTGHWGVLKRQQTATLVSEKYGIYKVQINNRQFNVDYKYVSHA
jgi:hypothetical protein